MDGINSVAVAANTIAVNLFNIAGTPQLYVVVQFLG
jgi:hypothetical protein